MDYLVGTTADFLVSIYPSLYVLAHIVGWVFVVSGSTELFFDLYRIAYSTRRFLLGRNWQPLALERLEAREQQRIAIFIAAWKEADVIAKTLTNACETIRYRNYDIFVGTYPNDPDTQNEVDRVARNNPHVHKVVTPDKGPTNKASNLNHVFQAMQDHESQNNIFFDIIVMHDSEDVIHPYSLLLYNYLIPRMGMIQIPVFPIALPLRRVTHWTYADEFAENHTKTLHVRELTGGFVPSAGVGTAFTKRAFLLLAIQHQQEVFSPNTLTEDYQLGLRLNLSGVKAAFVQVKIPSPKTLETGKKQTADWVATRALFPTDLKRAVRQKTRWNIGIILQGWQNLGWKGPFAVKWNLFQDRKALITSLANFLAYLVFAYVLLYSLINILYSQEMPVLIQKGSLLWYLVLIATFFMVWRALNRAYAVNKIYGWLPAITSIPRAVWGNFINFLAIVRAIYQFLLNQLLRRQVAWDKTMHEFPSDTTEEGRASAVGMDTLGARKGVHSMAMDSQKFIRLFAQTIQVANDKEKIFLLSKISQENGEKLFPYFIPYIKDPSWDVRSAVCRALSFLSLPQAIPHLEKAACDPDWVVRSNAVRAIGKFGDPGEEALLLLQYSQDRFAREAACAVLEQQAFLSRHLKGLKNPDSKIANKALRFFEILAKAGGSQLAKEILAEHLAKTRKAKPRKAN